MEKASPQIIPSQQFSLDNEAENKKIYLKLWPKAVEILTNEERNLFFRTGDSQNGWYAGYDRKVGLLYYLVQYKRLNKKLLGQTVTQTLVWRWGLSSLGKDVTQKVIFDILIPRYTTLLSDSIQTPEGKRLWENIMGRATANKCYVGLANLQTKEIKIPKENELVENFVRRVSKEAWGPSMKYQANRFLISKTPIEPR